jgi:hypothetical protein
MKTHAMFALVMSAGLAAAVQAHETSADFRLDGRLADSIN